MHDIEKSDTAFLLHWYLTIIMFPGQHCTSLYFRDFFVGLQYYTEMIFNSSDHFTIFITAPVSCTLSNGPTHEENTNFKVLNWVTSFILKFKYRNKVW